MANNDLEFNDFQVEDSAAYVNESIGNVIEKELSEVESFKEDLDDQLAMADDPKSHLTEMVIEYIQGVGDVSQVNLCSYNSKTGVAIDAWGFGGDEENTVIDLFLSMYVDPQNTKRLNAAEVDKHFNWMQRFFDSAQSGSLLRNLKSNDRSDLLQIAQLIKDTAKIDRVRLFLLTNAIVPTQYDHESIELGDDTICEFFVWDARRIMQQDRILTGKDPIVVDFERDYNSPLPCIKMPDVSPSVECYLCIIPGLILSQVYNKFHQQILEMNVRTFLQYKGASNKGIRNTLIGHKATAAEIRKGIQDVEAEPDMFFAYNNGISATASDVQLSEDGAYLTKIKSWQIVNGGQTTAVISSVMKMKDIDLSALSKVFVPMKISVVKDKDMISTIVPKISKYANTQSVVKKSDFNINERFLVELEQRSREEWVTNSSGKPMSKWFFERTRGQYLDRAKRAEGQSAQSGREFYAEYPKSQMIDKTALSKFMMAWDQNPASVCKGGEKNYTVFFDRCVKSGIQFDKTRYKRTIAKAILFKAIDALYGKDGLQLPGYKSNMVAYTVSLLSYQSNKALDLDAIWNEQCVISSKVQNELSLDLYSVYARLICGADHITYKIKETYTTDDGRRRNRYIPKEIPQEDITAIKSTKLYAILEYVKKTKSFVYEHLIEDVAEGENINERTKKPECWESMKIKLGGSMYANLYKTPKDICSTKGNMDEDITEGQQKYLDDAYLVEPTTWKDLYDWSKNNPDVLTPREQAFLGSVYYNAKKDKPLTVKQSKWALSLMEKAKDNGWTE